MNLNTPLHLPASFVRTLKVLGYVAGGVLMFALYGFINTYVINVPFVIGIVGPVIVLGAGAVNVTRTLWRKHRVIAVLAVIGTLAVCYVFRSVLEVLALAWVAIISGVVERYS